MTVHRRSGLLLAVLLVSTVALSQEQPRRGPREMGLVPEPTNNIMGWENPGDIPSLPDKGEYVVQKAIPSDCRVVLGFVHSPVDGRPDSWGYSGVVQEYDSSQGGRGGHWQNVTYEFIKDPGIHVTLADDAGFNYLYLRGGFEGLVYRDVDALDGPGQGTKIAEITNGTLGGGESDFSHILDCYRRSFPETVKARKISFFKRNNMLSDISFLRLDQAAIKAKYERAIAYHAGEGVADTTTLGPDFVRLNAKSENQHRCNFERRFPRQADRMTRLLAEHGPGQAVPLAAGQQVHFLTPILPANTPVGAVRMDLIIRGAPETNIINLAVQDPLIGSQELIRIDLKMNKSGKVQCLLDFPDQLTAEGRRFWITMASQNTATLAPESTISLLTVKPETAKAEYVAYRRFLLKGYFYVLSEARPWGHSNQMSVKWLTEYDGKEWNIQWLRPQLVELYTTVEHLHALAPEDPVISGQYYRWLARDPKRAEEIDKKFEQPALPEIPGVPRWAQLMDRAVRQIAEIPKWWIRNRMAPNGELGGFYSDDTDMVGWWTPSILMDSEGFAPLARDCLTRMAAGVLQYKLRDGVNLHMGDPLHAYEEGQNLMSQMPLAFYGDPRYVEWLMTSVRTCDKWMVRTPEGSLKWRVTDFGWRNANNPPPDIQPEAGHGDSDLMLHPHLILAWYNGNTNVIARLGAYIKGLPDTDGPRAYGAGCSVRFGAYWLTGDPKFLGFPRKTDKGDYDGSAIWNWFKRQPDAAVHAPEAREQPWWPKWAASYENATGNGHLAWAVKQRRDILVKSLENTLYSPQEGTGCERFRYMWTEAEVFTDRVFVPVQPVAQAMLGGYTVRNKLWPAYAVSYERLGNDFAALVLEQGRDRLKVAMVNLRDQPREGAFRVWQLVHGKYELTVGPDADDDGQMDAVEITRTLELARMDAVPVNLPPRRLTIYDLRQVEKLDDLYTRADLALSADDVVKNGDTLKVTVHNIGAKAATNIVVAAADASGKVLAKAAITSIEAPLDLVPKVASVELPAANAATIVIDPDTTIPEITRDNNSAWVNRSVTGG